VLFRSAGCQAILFSTGSVNPIGHPVSPTVKICANPQSVRRMSEHVDVDLSNALTKGLKLESCRKRIGKHLVSIINGEPVAAERLGYLETNISRIGQSV